MESPNTASDINDSLRDSTLLYKHGWTDENDWQFLTYLRDFWLVAPSGGPRNISPSTPNKDSDFSQYGQSLFIDKVSERGYVLEVFGSLGAAHIL